MTSKKDSQDTENKELEAEQSVADANQADAADAEPESEEAEAAPTPEEQLAAAEAKANENWDRFLRANAELENVRKRAQRDVEQAHKYGLEKFAAAVLDVCDSMEQGLERARKTAEEAGDVVNPLIEGMELTAKQLADVLTRFNIERLNAEGAAFNPDEHEAMTTLETDAQPPNTVVSVMRPGYRLNDRLLRPAMVIVAKAPTETTSTDEEAKDA